MLRSGKALGRDRPRSPPTSARCRTDFGQDSDPAPNVLRPDNISPGLNVNGPGDPYDLERVSLDTNLAPRTLGVRPILAVLSGNAMLSIHGVEAEGCLRIVAPVLEAGKAGAVPLLEYPAGSDGSPEAQEMLSERRTRSTAPVLSPDPIGE